MALQNAYSFTRLGITSHFVCGAGEDSSTEDDLIDYYGLEPTPQLAIHRIPRRLRGKNKTSSGPVFEYAKRLVRQLAIKQDVVVVSRDSSFLTTMARLCRYKRIHAYYELHDCYADLSWREKTRFGDRREQLLEWLFLRSIDGIICITREMEKKYDRLFPRIRKIALPLGTSPFPDQDPDAVRQRRTVAYVGHLQGAKGFNTILKLARPLKDRGIHLLCLGGYPQSVERVRKQLENENLADAIEIIPFQSPAGMHSQLRERASLGLSLLEDTYYNRHLTCPVKVLDYLSHGLPVLATDLPSNREVLADAGLYIEPGNTDAILNRIITCLDDADAYRTSAEASRTRSQQITWVTRALKLTEFFKNNHHLIPEGVGGKRRVLR